MTTFSLTLMGLQLIPKPFELQKEKVYLVAGLVLLILSIEIVVGKGEVGLGFSESVLGHHVFFFFFFFFENP